MNTGCWGAIDSSLDDLKGLYSEKVAMFEPLTVVLGATGPVGLR